MTTNTTNHIEQPNETPDVLLSSAICHIGVLVDQLWTTADAQMRADLRKAIGLLMKASGRLGVHPDARKCRGGYPGPTLEGIPLLDAQLTTPTGPGMMGVKVPCAYCSGDAHYHGISDDRTAEPTHRGAHCYGRSPLLPTGYFVSISPAEWEKRDRQAMYPTKKVKV